MKNSKTEINEIKVTCTGSRSIPRDELEIIFKKNYRGLVVVTFIQTSYGGIHKKLLVKLGYTPAMIKKIPSLIYQDGYDKILSYLALNGVKKIYEISKDRKHYLYFNLKTEPKGG